MLMQFSMKFQTERKGTFKVEFLQKIEKDVQEKWEREKVNNSMFFLPPMQSANHNIYPILGPRLRCSVYASEVSR
jgi:hypothetical protein